MRINWFSNAPWANTGYGNQTRLFVPRLRNKLGHAMSCTAFYGVHGAQLNFAGVPVYPSGRHPYGMDIMSANAAYAKADIILPLMDAWVIDLKMNPHAVPIVPWYPVDMEPLPRRVADVVRRCFSSITYSRFGQRMAAYAGIDSLYVPHGVDTDVFSPGSRSDARAKLRCLGLPMPDDAFVIGMVAANKGAPSRKAFEPQLSAFKMFRQRHSDAIMYLHTQTGSGDGVDAVDLVALCRHLDLEIGRDVLFCDQYTNGVLGFSDEFMVTVYRAIDVLTSVSMGEGFGVPILEAQACGTPVIVGDWTAMPEICFSGWRIERGDAYPMWTPLEAYQLGRRAEAILEAYEQAYVADLATMANKARSGALDYAADVVTDKFWRPALLTIQERLEASQSPPPEAIPLGDEVGV